MPLMPRRLSSTLLPALLLFAPLALAPAVAQTPKKPPVTQATNVQTGTLVSLDTEAATLVLKPRSGADLSYRLTDKTLVFRGKKAVEPAAFKAGDEVVVRFRRSTVGPASLYDLADKASWDWLYRLRRETTLGTVKEAREDGLTIAEGADKAELHYRATEKTAWSRAGKPAAALDFKPGEPVYVVPRLLPGGGVMAVAVSDASADAAKLKERSKTTVTGTIKSVDAEKRAIALRSTAGDERDLTASPDCAVRHNGKDVPFATVKPGLTVTVHLKRDETGERVARLITIKSARAPARPAPAAKPMKKP
jgi:Cu/Ag efflux protein CusF